MTVKPKYFQEAERLLGLKEISGKGTAKEITSLWSDAGMPEIKDDETPWCAAFANGCLVRGNKPSTKSGLARSFLFPENKDKYEQLSKPEKYCIGIMKRGNSSWSGHVGFVTDFDDKYVWMLGGNQGNQVSIAKFPRSSFKGQGVGFAKPLAKATDVTKEELKKDSRQLKVGGWFEKIQLAVGGAIGAAYTVWDAGKQFIQDNTSLVLIGTVVIAWFGYKVIESYTINAYREGRYLPKAHE
jgi:uncharacterized protein (TIGR02594 family)